MINSMEKSNEEKSNEEKSNEEKSNQILELELDDRHKFIELLNSNQGVYIFKFTASWCRGCKKIESYVHKKFIEITNLSKTTYCFTLDVDDNFDIYAHLKHKKMVSGIPVLLCYVKGNTEYYSSDSISGTNITEIDAFFERCKNY